MSPRRRTAPATEGQGENAAELQRLLDLESQARLDGVIAELNAKHALLVEHGKAIIISERFEPVLKRWVLDRSHPADLSAWYADRSVTITTRNGRPVTKSLFDYWFTNPQRRKYSDIVFDPGIEHPSHIYNLWKGFSVEPKPGNWSALQDHVHEIICAGDDQITRYLTCWMAKMIQHPGRPGEVGIVMRGGQGAGKGILVRALGHLFGQHFVHISRPEHLVGNFNAHLQDAVLVFADEAVWGGDKSSEGALKALITEPTLPIERKGRDTFIVKNVIHLMVASNNAWAVPAGMDDRRFLVLDVLNTKVGNHDYFTAIDTQMKAGGYEAMLFDLQHIDLTDFNHRQPPQTAALLDQKIRAFNPVQRWWFNKLHTGCLLPTDDGWTEDVFRKEFYADCIESLKSAGVQMRPTEIELGMALAKLLPKGWPQSKRRMHSVEKKQMRTHCFPSLQECRAAFSLQLRQQVQWPEVAEPTQGELRKEERP